MTSNCIGWIAWFSILFTGIGGISYFITSIVGNTEKYHDEFKDESIWFVSFVLVIFSIIGTLMYSLRYLIRPFCNWLTKKDLSPYDVAVIGLGTITLIALDDLNAEWWIKVLFLTVIFLVAHCILLLFSWINKGVNKFIRYFIIEEVNNERTS
ncbi:hypothetical protein [Marinobacterium litorale]|uniref:hypothetical protein n=1 Tax=Marinobacterium litorale TaxID=404770 RepID=UPI000481C267|nr:hypothetical protein [Marinobacterium litorale]